MSWKAGPVYPCNPWTARSESTKLSSDPKGEKLVYTNGRAVVIRDLNNPSLSHVYTQHTQSATVARISPSGFYCASADVAGNVRIWDVTNPENVLKFAGRPISGKINDLAWDGESKRIIVGGEGKDKFGAAFFMDSGSSCGEITGHSKPITSVAIRHQRPFRAVSGSDDNSVCFHTAVPFKYDKMFSHHTRFVRDVQYSPNGDLFASVASDGKLIFYDGKTGELKVEAKREETSSLMAASWSPDSKQIATAGADGVVAIWDAESGQSSQTWTIGDQVEDQQNGIVWTASNVIASVSLSGTINLFDPRDGGSKWRKLHGPTKAVTASGFNETEKAFYTGSFDGSIKSLSIGDTDKGAWNEVDGTGHSARIVSFDTEKAKTAVAGWDDRITTISENSFSSSFISSQSQPAGLAISSSATYVATPKGLEIHASSGSPNIVAGDVSAVAAQDKLVAYGSGKKLVLASSSGTEITPEADFSDNKGDILSIAISPKGDLVAAGDAAGRIILVDTAKKETLVTSRWTFHTGRIVALAFSPDGKRLASAGMDESIYIWETEKVGKNTAIKNAHPGGVSGVSWTSDDQLISSGQDGCARTWSVPKA